MAELANGRFLRNACPSENIHSHCCICIFVYICICICNKWPILVQGMSIPEHSFTLVLMLMTWNGLLMMSFDNWKYA